MTIEYRARSKEEQKAIMSGLQCRSNSLSLTDHKKKCCYLGKLLGAEASIYEVLGSIVVFYRDSSSLDVLVHRREDYEKVKEFLEKELALCSQVNSDFRLRMVENG